MADAQQKTSKEAEAYKRFQKETRGIMHEFTEQASELLQKIDAKRAEAIRKRIDGS